MRRNFSWSNTEILDHIKSGVLRGGTSSVFGFMKTVSQAAKADKIGKEELANAFSKFNVKLTLRNMDKLARLFGAGSDGAISAQELIQTLVGEMNGTRSRLVQQVFSALDADKDGSITTQEMVAGFNKLNGKGEAEFGELVETYFGAVVLVGVRVEREGEGDGGGVQGVL